MTIVLLPPPPGAPAAIRAAVELVVTDGPLAGLRLTGITIEAEPDGLRVTWPAACHAPTPAIAAHLLQTWRDAERADGRRWAARP